MTAATAAPLRERVYRTIHTAKRAMTATVRQYSSFQIAYDRFNQTLFAGALPLCLITLQRKARARGFFRSAGFVARTGDGTTDEIALNPDNFLDRSDREILSTLCHEMVHLWQHQHGKPGRTGYHNAEWADMMERVGLMPTDSGLPGGKRVGQKMTHYIMEGGPFDHAVGKFLSGRPAVDWSSATASKRGKDKATSASMQSKTKFSCPACGQNAWARPTARLACCNADDHPMGDVVAMVPLEVPSAAEGTS